MNAEELIEKIENEFPALEKGKLKADNNIASIFDWNSLNVFILIHLIYDEYGVVIKMDDLKNRNTMNEFCDLINQRIKK